jgi:hypothetical protein
MQLVAICMPNRQQSIVNRYVTFHGHSMPITTCQSVDEKARLKTVANNRKQIASMDIRLKITTVGNNMQFCRVIIVQRRFAIE